MLRSRSVQSLFVTLALFTALAGDALRNTIGWVGWGVVIVAVVAYSVALLVANRAELRLQLLPLPLVAFLVLATASVAWSFYPGASALGTLAQWATSAVAAALTLLLDWRELLRQLGRVLRLILGLSLIFEFVVAVFVRHPVLPFWVDYGDGDLPIVLYWSRGLLFESGKIQGVVGNSALLGFVSLLAVIVFAVQFAVALAERGGGPDAAPATTVSRRRSVRGWLSGSSTLRRRIVSAAVWFVVAGLVLVITDSATIYVGVYVVAFVACAVVFMRRVPVGWPRTLAYAVSAAVVAASAAAIFVAWGSILGLLGKSGTLTGRTEIWEKVAELAQQRPAFGWGWVSYWVPWVEPFASLDFRNGVQQLHAHNAWLDVWLQLGAVGLLVFGLLVLGTLIRCWFVAIDGTPALYRRGGRVELSADAARWSSGQGALALLPLMLLTALLVQSLTESRILIEGGWVLLVFVAMRAKVLAPAPDRLAPAVAAN